MGEDDFGKKGGNEVMDVYGRGDMWIKMEKKDGLRVEGEMAT